ncbi:MAG: hypothetical protein HKN87_12225 [Saprospiraceae bacterium]|nr:hypothetical protein [Saprospiraceae bacterium]
MTVLDYHDADHIYLSPSPRALPIKMEIPHDLYRAIFGIDLPCQLPKTPAEPDRSIQMQHLGMETHLPLLQQFGLPEFLICYQRLVHIQIQFEH